MPRSETTFLPVPLHAKRQIRHLLKSLRDVVKTNRAVLASMDKVMLGKDSYERGKQIGQCMSALQFGTDAADYFGLGKKLRKVK